MVEKGRSRPKPKTVESLANALNLTDEERREFHRLAGLEKLPELVRDELAVYASLELPGMRGSRHLPELVWAAPHNEVPMPSAVPAAAEACSIVASAAAWGVLRRSEVSRSQAKTMIGALEALRLKRAPADPTDPVNLLGIAASLWRDVLFSSRAAASRLCRDLVRWDFDEAAWSFVVQFRGAIQDLSGGPCDPRAFRSVFDSLTCERVVSRLPAEYAGRNLEWARYRAAAAVGPAMRLLGDDANLARESALAIRRSAAVLRLGLHLFDEPPLARLVFGELDRPAVEAIIATALRVAESKPHPEDAPAPYPDA